MDSFAAEMFEVGENLSGRTPEELLSQDFKVFMCGETRFGICQINFMSEKNLQTARQLLSPCLRDGLSRQKVEDLYVLLTSISNGSSTVLCAGKNAAEILSDAFPEAVALPDAILLKGIISRKKQFLPALMSAYQQL